MRRVLIALVLVGVAPAVAAEVTPERLANALDEPQNWLMDGGDYQAHRYSRLDAINRDTVGGLIYAFSFPNALGAGELFEHMRLSSPLVTDGFMYITDGLGRVTKLDLSSGTQAVKVWTTEVVADHMDPWLLGQWTLALAGDEVIFTVGSGAVYWLDAETGAIARSQQVADPATGYVLAAPPLVTGGQVIVGGAGAERGALPEIDALDLATGNPLWQTQLALRITGRPEFAAARVPGGSYLRTGSYADALGLSFWSTSGPLPAYDLDARVGTDDSNSIVAVDAATGTAQWSFAYPPDAMGFSEAATHPVIAISANGHDVPKLVHIGDNGRFYRFDAATGAVELDTELLPPAVAFEEALASGTDLDCQAVASEVGMPITVSERSGLVYGALNHGCLPLEASDGYVAAVPLGGLLVAVDPATGETVAEHRFDSPLQSGLLSTAGGIVIAVTADGTVQALDDTTLEVLATYAAPSVVASPPMTFAIGERQFIAFYTGGGPFYSDLAYASGGARGVRHITTLVVLGLDEP